MTQAELADKAGMRRDLIAQIESGKSQLPVPENRRKLAAALGLSHLDLLTAAGEITREEIEPLKVQGVAPTDPIRDELIERLRRVRLTARRVKTLDSILDLMLGFDSEERSEEVTGTLHDTGVR